MADKSLENDEETYFDHLFDKVDPNVKLDQEQRKVILTEDDYVMIIAGAGAGKTTTMAAKVKYLVEKKKIPPENIIMISLTNKAVEELKDKINQGFQLPVPILTFHKFGMQVLKDCGIKRKLCRNPNSILQKFLKEKLEEENFQKQMLHFFAYYLDIPNYAIQNTKKYQIYRQKIEYFSLLGKVAIHNEKIMTKFEEENITIENEVMRTRDETVVANYLFLHGIKHHYLKPYPYHFTYTPNFTIFVNQNVYYIDLFGEKVKGISLFQYQRKQKKIWKLHDKYHTNHIFLKSEQTLLEELEFKLKQYEVPLLEKNQKEIFLILKELEKEQDYQRFLNLCMTFIHSFKTNGYEREKFTLWKTQMQNQERTYFFLQILEEMYLYYETYLEEQEEIDFDDMIRLATKKLKENKIKLPYQYIIVDEYQDISEERFHFLKEVVKVSHSKLLVVGDDWQSIFAFAGSNISLFMNFEKEMGKATKLPITHTYRNSQELIDIAGNFIMKNEKQFKKQLSSPKHLQLPVKIYLYDDRSFPQSKIEVVESCISKIVENSRRDVEILLIGRLKKDKEQ